MALKYVVKKRVFGFDKTKTEKYVAQNVITNTVNFRDLCKEVSMFGMIPEGAVKHVIDALIDALNTNLNKGLSVQLGDFGCFRPGMNCKSQNEEKDESPHLIKDVDVDADTVRRVKIVFTPGYKFKDMLDNVSIYKTEGNGGTSSGNGGGNKPENPDEGGSGEAPDPAA
jgi:predicted histone-like DNA-binding protein